MINHLASAPSERRCASTSACGKEQRRESSGVAPISFCALTSAPAAVRREMTSRAPSKRGSSLGTPLPTC